MTDRDPGDHPPTSPGVQWPHAPDETVRQVWALTHALRDQLGPELIGVYLHGSLALGGFHPAHSDLDLLVVCRTALSADQKAALGRDLLRWSAQPHGVELSVLSVHGLHPWRHPAPFEFHYSEDWRDATEQALSPGSWTLWPAGVTDPDLAAHITVLRTRGVTLSGRPAAEVFPEVPTADYLASVLTDVREALSQIEETQEYAVLNLCRTLAFLSDGGVRSKAEGGEWALAALPAELQPTVARALHAYQGRGPAHWQPGELAAFTRWAVEQLPRP